MIDIQMEPKKFEANSKWFSRHYNKLSKKYPYEYVAVHNRKVVDHDEDIKRLLERVNKKFGETSRVIPIEYVSPEKVDLIL